jgi:hypothetical protein
VRNVATTSTRPVTSTAQPRIRTNPTWDEIPKADRTEIERAIYAAANDDC